jgi:predicted RNase H-like HicB family nuclease
MEYSVVVHEAEEGGYWIEVPALPGCYSQGETVKEALENAKEAIELYLDALREQGGQIPKDEEIVFKVAVPS